MKRQLIVIALAVMTSITAFATPNVVTSSSWNTSSRMLDEMYPKSNRRLAGCLIDESSLSGSRKERRIGANIHEWTDTEYNVNYEYNPEDCTASVKAGLWHDNDTWFRYSDPWSPYDEHSSAGSPDASGRVVVRSSIIIGGKKYIVKEIGECAFAHNSQITSVEIEDGVNTIQRGAFTWCTGITNIVLPNSLDTIGSVCFSYCIKLKSLHIPAGLKYIDGALLTFCKNLESLTVAEDNEYFDSRNNCQAIIKTATNELVSGTHNTQIPEGVTSIHKSAFIGRPLLQSIKIPSSVTSIGNLAFGACENLKSIVISDGVASIGSAAFCVCTSLKSINLPNSVRIIGSEAFYDCENLQAINLPEGINTIEESAFESCVSLRTITIPSSVTSLGDWSFYNCTSLKRVISYITDIFPISYVFPLHLDGGIYESYASLYVPAGTTEIYQATLGWNVFTNIIEIEDKPHKLIVTDENDIPLTDGVTIIWYEDSEIMSIGNTATVVRPDMNIYYSIELDDYLGRKYCEIIRQPYPLDKETVTCKLKEIDRIMLEGRVSGLDIEENLIIISVVQKLNGKWEQEYNTQTDEQGMFKIEVYDDNTDITISGDDYFDATLHRDGFNGNGNVGVIPILKKSAFTIAAKVNIQKAVTTDVASKVTAWTGDLNNIDFTLNNTTQGTPITEFTVQGGNICIKKGANIGDEISLEAKSKQGVFADATTSFSITEGSDYFELNLIELGGLDATCVASNNVGTVGCLYDSGGVLVAKGSYIGEVLSLRHLPNGCYTLVSMGNNSLLGGITRLSNFGLVGLSEGTDYVATPVEVTDGELTAVSVNEVPQLDDTKFCYTNNNTYFKANKASVTAGDYLTLQAYVDFKTEYSDRVDRVTLNIDLPEGCKIVENSVIANRKAVAHTVNGNRITIPLNKEQMHSQLRFCLIPTLNQKYTITALATFNGQVTQPIGTAQFEAKGLSLSTPSLTTRTNITINGTAIGHSEVSIYDNDVYIGKTSSKADGSWTAVCELYKPYSFSFHDIYAKITTDSGIKLTSEAQQVEYDKNMIVPEKVTMTYYNGWYRKNETVEFDLINGTSSPSSWPFYSATEFTFLADFTSNDSTQIKNVNIKVLNSDGTVRTLPATFDGKQGKWVATTKYSGSSGRLPKNVKVEYDFLSVSEIYDEEMEEAMNTLINNMLEEVDNAYKDCHIDVLGEDENTLYFSATTNEYNTKENFKLCVLDYEQVLQEFSDDFYYHLINDTTDICFIVDSKDDVKNGIIIWDNLTHQACSLYTDANHNTTQAGPRKIIPFIMGAVLGVGLSVYEYNTRMNEIQNWYKTIDWESERIRKQYDKMIELLYAKCDDGSYKIKDEKTINFELKLANQWQDSARQYLYDFKNAVDLSRNRLKQLCTIRGTANVVIAAGGAMVSGAVGIAGGAVAGISKWSFSTLGVLLTQSATTVMLEGANQLTSEVLNYYITPHDSPNLPNYKISPEMLITNWHSDNLKKLTNEYVEVIQWIKASYSKCSKDEDKDKPRDDDDNFNGKGSTPEIDPSGYVYEAVMSNRLAGVTATCYQKVQGEDMYGDATEDAVVWNAEDYSQENPLQTDATGFYRWDVPMGMWQVKYEKEGYETTYSDWLPVPPPQLDVNVGMKHSTPPTVEQMHGVESGITIEMSKYMRPETFVDGSVTVKLEGVTQSGHLEMVNLEQEPLGEASFASRIKFVPDTRFHAGDEVVVTVKKDVESYCGVAMMSDHTQTVVIESEIEAIVADSVISIPYGDKRLVQVLVMPKDAAVGRTLKVATSSSMIASLSSDNITIGTDGIAEFTVSGNLPGGVVLTLAVEGTDASVTSKVSVINGRDLVSIPMASIRNGEQVDCGTTLTLTCATPGATIYYTLDGTCPCDEATRIEYTGSFTLPSGVITVKAVAEAEDMDDSDVATFIYDVAWPDGISTAKASHEVNMSMTDDAIIVANAEGANCIVYDLRGNELACKYRLDKTAFVSVPLADVYIVSLQFADGQTVVKKVRRR